MGAFNSNTKQVQDYNFDFSQEWQVISDNKSTRFVNKFSQDEFLLKMIDFSTKDHNAFTMRQLYSFYHSPRIVLLLQDSTFIQLLVQDAPKTLKVWLTERNLSQTEQLILLKTIMQGFNSLHKKFGPFYVTEKMVRINKKGRILLWINEKFQSNHIQYKLPQSEGQQTMISQIIKPFSKLIKKLDLQMYPTFEESINFIQKTLITNSLRQTDCSDWKKKDNHMSHHHSRKLTDQFKNRQTTNSKVELRITDLSKNSNASPKNPQQCKKNYKYFESPRNGNLFLSEMNSSELVESATQGSDKNCQDYRHQRPNKIQKGKKNIPHQFQINLKSQVQENRFQIRRYDNGAAMQTINEVSKSNISIDSPSVGLKLKRNDSGQEISSPQIRKIRAQLNCLL